MFANSLTDDPAFVTKTDIPGPWATVDPSTEYRVVSLKATLVNVSAYTSIAGTIAAAIPYKVEDPFSYSEFVQLDTFRQTTMG